MTPVCSGWRPFHHPSGYGLSYDIARNRGAERITLGSSLNAVGFYTKCGYVKKESSTIKCNDGVELVVVKSEKVLRN